MRAFIEIKPNDINEIEPQILEVIGVSNKFYQLKGFDFYFLDQHWDKVTVLLVRQYWEEDD